MKNLDGRIFLSASDLMRFRGCAHAHVPRSGTHARHRTGAAGLTVSLQGGRLFCLSAQDSERGLFQTKPDILIRRGGMGTHVIDTKWKVDILANR